MKDDEKMSDLKINKKSGKLNSENKTSDLKIENEISKSKNSEMQIGELYKGFRVKQILNIEDCSSKGVFLVHERTGMEIFHLLNQDKENLFCFAFRTPSQNSTGLAHIMEHSVLCGSKNYPLKDPFIRLSNQSINTYLNALTASDRTMFPAASTVKEDYFNLLSVYADAVFFPLLTKETFLQEGFRLEFDKDENPEIQGVVYNEMKGSYSSFDSVSDDEIQKVIHEGTPYVYDSGGDPMEIPSLTYEQFKAFHKKYYCPANCMLFLYGNVSTYEQLDFLDEKVLSKIQNPGKKINFPKPKKVETKKFVKVFGPDDSEEIDSEQNEIKEIQSDSSDNQVTLQNQKNPRNQNENSKLEKQVAVVAWKMKNFVQKGEFSKLSMEIMFLSDLLFGDDSAPLSKALLESKLGSDLAVQNGHNLTTCFYSLTFGLSGVEEKNAFAVEDLIFKTLNEICEQGIDEMDLKRTCLDFDFMNREIKRFRSPYSMVYMQRVFSCWTYGENPWEKLLFREKFENFKKEILSNQDYLKSLIKKYFIDNQDYTLIFAEPSKSWSKNRELQEKENAQKLLKTLGKEKALKNLKMLKVNQNRDETEFENLIPHVKISDVDYSPENVNLKKILISGVPYAQCVQPTNGIVYFTIVFPVDVLKPKDYTYLTLLSSAATELGWQGLKWNDALRLIQTKCGGFSCYVHSSNPVPDFAQKLVSQNPLTKGRDFLVFNMKCLSEDFSDALEIFKNCIFKTDFSDVQRLKTVLTSLYNASISYLNSSAHIYAAYRSVAKQNRFSAQKEILEGVSSIFYLKEQKEMEVQKLSKKLNSLLKTIRSSGAMIYAISDEKTLSTLKNPIKKMINEFDVKFPKEKLQVQNEEFYKLTDICTKNCLVKNAKISKNENFVPVDEAFIIPGTVAYTSAQVESEIRFSKKSLADEVLTHCLATSDLWNKIRVEGGSYGVFFGAKRMNGLSAFGTYRDPKPFDSINVFYKILEDLKNRNFDKETVEKAVSGIFSEEIEPKVPSQKGLLAISYDWNAYPSNFEKRYLKYLQEISARDINLSALRYSVAKKGGKVVVFCPKSLLTPKNSKKCRKIIQLSL